MTLPTPWQLGVGIGQHTCGASRRVYKRCSLRRAALLRSGSPKKIIWLS